MDYITPFNEIAKDVKNRYINKALEFLKLNTGLLNNVKNNDQLIDKVLEFAEDLYKRNLDYLI